MILTSTLQNHLRVSKPIFGVLRQVSRLTKDLHNVSLYIQRQHFFATGKILSLASLFQQVKTTPEYKKLPSDLAQQVLLVLRQNLNSFFGLLKLKSSGTYSQRVRLPSYLDVDDHYALIFIPRLFKICKQDQTLRLSLGHRGAASTGTRFIHLDLPPLGIEPRQIRIIPRYKASYFDIEYIYETSVILRDKPPLPDSYLSIDLGLQNFATCVTTSGTAFIVEGSGIVSFHRWWNKRRARYQSMINTNGVRGPTRRSARMQRYRRHVINNYLNHVVRYIVDHCLEHGIATIILGEWGDMKRGLSMRRQQGQLFQTIPYRWFKSKLAFRAQLHDIGMLFQEESYTSQDCSGCGLRRKANRVHRGLYCCVSCGLKIQADINGAINIMKKVVTKDVLQNMQCDSGEITSPSRIQLVGFV